MKNKQAKRHLLALLLAVVLLISIAVPVVGATGTAEIAFGQISGKCGEQVTVPVTIKNNPGIASFRFRIAYDATALTYVSTDKGEALTGGTLSAAYQPDDQELAITWFDVKNAPENGVILNLVFEITDTASGLYPLTVRYLPADVVNASWQRVSVGVVDGWVRTGYNITGTVNGTGTATVKLMQGDTQIASTETTNGEYKLISVEPGNYTLVASKPGYAPRTYQIAVADADVTQQIVFYKAGDIDINGAVDTDDVVQLLLHVAMPDIFSIETLADFTGEGSVTTDDVVQLLLHVAMPDLFPLQVG